MPHALLLSVRFHDGRYHGRPEWPPSPARLFQALVAGAAKGEALCREDRDALAWLEQLEPPLIAAPTVRAGNGFRNYVPNNDLDAVGGDPRRIGEIKAPKLIKPWLFDVRVPLLYAWQFEHGAKHAARIFEISELIGECLRRGLPRPEVEVLELEAGPRGGGMMVRARLEFAVGVRGPLLLGRDSHMGGGLFVSA
jgi:CRISPR-associated protein Csb2